MDGVTYEELYISASCVKWADSVRGSRTETTTPVQFSFVLLYIFFHIRVFVQRMKIECFWWNSSNKSERETQPKLQEADYPIGFLKENTMYVYMLTFCHIFSIFLSVEPHCPFTNSPSSLPRLMTCFRRSHQLEAWMLWKTIATTSLLVSFSIQRWRWEGNTI